MGKYRSETELRKILKDITEQLVIIHKAGFTHMHVSLENLTVENIDGKERYRIRDSEELFETWSQIRIKRQNYIWHKKTVPPEYSYCSLRGTDFCVKPTYDIYCLMILILKFGCGQKVNEYDDIEKMWNNMIDCTVKDESGKEWWKQLFHACTRRNETKRPQDAMHLVDMYKI